MHTNIGLNILLIKYYFKTFKFNITIPTPLLKSLIIIYKRLYKNYIMNVYIY